MKMATMTSRCLAELGKAWRRLGHLSDSSVIHFIDVDMGTTVGVFGDGDNATYEWFIWKDNGALETSNVQYGLPAAALRDVLIKALG